jgi:hypothetical protein
MMALKTEPQGATASMTRPAPAAHPQVVEYVRISRPLQESDRFIE